MTMRDDLILSDEVLAVVQMECSTETTLVIKELEFIFRTFDLISGQPTPSFANFDDRERRSAPIREIAAYLKRHHTSRGLIQGHRSRIFQIEDNPIAVQKLRQA
jgi:hypothetical protein